MWIPVFIGLGYLAYVLLVESFNPLPLRKRNGYGTLARDLRNKRLKRGYIAWASVVLFGLIWQLSPGLPSFSALKAQSIDSNQAANTVPIETLQTQVKADTKLATNNVLPASANTTLADTASADTASADTASTDTVSANTASVNTASSDTLTGEITQIKTDRALTIQVKPGDTLLKIASGVKGPEGFTSYRKMMRIYDSNPNAFAGSPDTLQAGSTLTIPDWN